MLPAISRSYKAWRAIRAFVSALRINVFDLQFELNPSLLGQFKSLSLDTLPKHGYVIRLGSFLFQMLRALKEPEGDKGESILPCNGVLFFATTKNQHDALAPVCRLISNGYFAGEGASRQINIPYRRITYVFALPFLPLLILYLWKSKDYREMAGYYLDRLWFTYGYYVAAYLWLAKARPKAVIFANDHSYPNRTVLEVARNQGIPTFYVQHASVTSRFPVLAFDYALLDGMRALETYDSIGRSQTQVFLVGMPKADIFCRSRNNRTTVQTLGIATNRHDPVEKVEELCSGLRTELLQIPIILRPHPRERMERMHAWKRIAERYRIEMSHPEKETAFDFLARCDAIIAGRSGILLEAAVADVVPLYYDFIMMKFDDYGFLKMGLSEYFCDPKEMASRIVQLTKKKISVRTRAKPFVNTVGTVFDGRSSELVASLIGALAEGKSEIMEKWRRIPGVKLEAYELDTSKADPSFCRG